MRRAGLLFVLLFVVYSPVMRGSYLWDDSRHIPDRPSFYTRAGLKLIWTQQGYTQQYYPLTFTTLWVEHHLWGGSPLGYHLVTLIFHGCNAVLLALLLAELGFPAAWWVAFLFALHPIEVESVAWMTELKNTQSTFFYLLALLIFLRRRSYALIFFFYLCALASKTVSGTWPAVALILLWYKKERVRANDAIALIPFFAAGLALGLVTSGFEKNILGAVGPAWDFSAYEHLLIAGRAFWFYIGKLLWPWPLNFIYPLWDARHFGWWNALFPAAVVLLFGILWLGRRRWGKAPPAAMMIFAACIVPALGFIHLYPLRYSFVADHFQYQAGIGVIALVVAMIWRLERRARVAVLTSLCVVFGAATWSRARVFRSPEALYRDILAKNPSCLMAMDNLAVTLLNKGAIPEARAIVDRSIRGRPDDLDALMLMGRLRLDYDHDPVGALPYFQKAYRQILDFHPSHARQGYLHAIHLQLAEAYFEAERYGEAETLYRAALDDIPALSERPFFDLTREGLASSEAECRARLADWRMHKGLADLLVRQGKNEEAVSEYRQAVDLNPESSELSNRLGALLLKLGRKREALAVYRAALKRKSWGG